MEVVAVVAAVAVVIEDVVGESDAVEDENLAKRVDAVAGAFTRDTECTGGEADLTGNLVLHMLHEKGFFPS